MRQQQSERHGKGYQQRSIAAGEFIEARAVSDDEGGAPTTIRGYAAVFNSPAYGEVIRPGAFSKTLQETADIRAYWNHNADMVLGRTSNGTLELHEDERGLYTTIRPNLATSWGRDAIASVARGDVRGMSFGFRVVKSKQDDPQALFELLELALREVSPCSDPWYDATTVEAREWAEETDEDPGPVTQSAEDKAARARRHRAHSVRLRAERYRA